MQRVAVVIKGIKKPRKIEIPKEDVNVDKAENLEKDEDEDDIPKAKDEDVDEDEDVDVGPVIVDQTNNGYDRIGLLFQ